MCKVSSKKQRGFPVCSLSGFLGHDSFVGWKWAGQRHREYGSFLKAAAKTRKALSDRSQKLCLSVSLHTMMNCILFPSLALGFNNFAAQTWIKIPEWFQSGDDFIHWCYMSESSCIPFPRSVSFSNISQAESSIRYPYTKSSVSSSEKQLFKWISSFTRRCVGTDIKEQHGCDILILTLGC